MLMLHTTLRQLLSPALQRPGRFLCPVDARGLCGPEGFGVGEGVRLGLVLWVLLLLLLLLLL